MIRIPYNLKPKRKVDISANYLIEFENNIKDLYNKSKIPHPIHLSGNNEVQLIEIFRYISESDYVFSTWRSHYHALLHGLDPSKIKKLIIKGKSMSLCDSSKNFYASSIVGGCIPIAVGTAMALKKKNIKKKVWCFVGDMSFETGIFYENHKYATNLNLPITFIIEDNGLSTNTPTKDAWGKANKKIPNNVIYYKYKRTTPHHGTGSWVLF